MPRVPHPYGVEGDAALPLGVELRDRLATRLHYARFKIAHDRIAHTLSELENLYLRPFQAQAERRAAAKRNDPRRQRWRREALEADDARERGLRILPPEKHVDVGLRPSAIKLGKRKAVDDAPLHDSPHPPATQQKSKAKELVMRFQGLPPTLDMNAVVRDPKTTWAPPPRRTDEDEDEEDVPMPAQPFVVEGRGRAGTRTSSSSSSTDVDAWIGPPNGAAAGPDPDRLRSLRRTTSEAHSPQSAHSIARHGSGTSLHTNGSSAASLLLNGDYVRGPSPPTTSASSHPPTSAAPSLYAGDSSTDYGPSPYTARSSAAFGHTTLAPASSSLELPLASRRAFHPGPTARKPLHRDPSHAAPSWSVSHPSASSSPGGRTAPSAAATGSARSRLLGSQASFSALPPPPPLPFDSQPDAWSAGAHGAGSWIARPPCGSGSGSGVRAGGAVRTEGTGLGGSTGAGPGDDEWSEVVRPEDVRAAAAALFSSEGPDAATDADGDGAREEDEDEGGTSRPPSPSGSDDERDLDADGEDDAGGLPRYPPLSQDTLVDSQDPANAHDEGEPTQDTQEMEATQEDSQASGGSLERGFES